MAGQGCDINRENPRRSGPVGQLGARFHGMEEVVSSNLTRSTKTFQTLSAGLPSSSAATGVQKEFQNGRQGPVRAFRIWFSDSAFSLIPMCRFWFQIPLPLG